MTMCSRVQVDQMIRQMNQCVRALFPEGKMEVILFGSYARREETDGSDIDVMYLVDAPRAVIMRHNWQIGEAAADIMLEYGVVISPIVENREYFHAKADVLPFFANVQREGVSLSA